MDNNNFTDFLEGMGMNFDDVLYRGQWYRAGWEMRFLGCVRDDVIASSRVVLSGGPVHGVDYGDGGVVVFVDDGDVVRGVSRLVRAARVDRVDGVAVADVALRDALMLSSGLRCFSVSGSCVASNFLLTIICPPAVRGVRLFDCVG